MAHYDLKGTSNLKLFQMLKRTPSRRQEGHDYRYIPSILTKIEKVNSLETVKLIESPRNLKDKTCLIEKSDGTQHRIFWRDLAKL